MLSFLLTLHPPCFLPCLPVYSFFLPAFLLSSLLTILPSSMLSFHPSCLLLPSSLLFPYSLCLQSFYHPCFQFFHPPCFPSILPAFSLFSLLTIFPSSSILPSSLLFFHPLFISFHLLILHPICLHFIIHVTLLPPYHVYSPTYLLSFHPPCFSLTSRLSFHPPCFFSNLPAFLPSSLLFLLPSILPANCPFYFFFFFCTENYKIEL